MFQRLRMFVRFLTCFLILLAVAVQRNGSVFGHDIHDTTTESASSAPITTEGNSIVINTTTIAKDIKGYGGPVPLEITVTDGKIAKIETLKNAESEQFFGRARSGLIPQWIGVPVSEVQAKEIDAISGATLSSVAINQTIKTAIAYASDNSTPVAETAPGKGFNITLRYIAVILVVLCGAIIPLFFKDKRYRYVQLILNVVVLGFWSGTFLSYEVFVNYIAEGADLWRSLGVFLMLIVAFIYPYYGKKSHYCTWVCPLGSLQELAGKCIGYKIKLPVKLVKGLTFFQEYLWFVLIFLMIAGIWFDWMNMELFTAFIFESAATGVLIAAAIVILLSFVIQRPYCRFICPTGCLYQITQNPDK